MNRLSKKIVNVLSVIALGFMMEIVASVILETVLQFFPETSREYSEMVSQMIEPTLQMILLVVVVSPIIEELIFRGAVLSIAKKITPFYVANIIQALLFGIYHGNIVQGIYAFLLGLLIGCLKKRYGKLIYTILFHMSLNLTGVYLDKLEEAWEFVVSLVVSLTEKMPNCFIEDLTGLFCPGCGMTRAVIALLEGKILKSLYYNVIVMYAVIAIAYLIIKQICHHTIKTKAVTQRLILNILYTGAGIIVLQWIIKVILLLVFHIKTL